MELAEMSEVLKNCGVVGAGGAGFPSYAKLSDKAEILVLNCAECEPLFRVHRQLLSVYTTQIMIALQEIKKAVGAREVVIAMKPSYKQAAEAVQYLLDRFDDFRIGWLTETYPSGDEIITIYETTGRLIEPGKLPISQGVILYNVETMLNAYNAITSNHPVCSKHLTVSGAVNAPVTVKVPVGITLREAVQLAGGEAEDDLVYINGGTMTGRIASPSDTVTKTTNAVLLLPKDHYVIMKKQSNIKADVQRSMSSCCQCQTCTDLCSRHLLGYPIEPHMVMRAAAKGMDTDTQSCMNTAYCSACGLCEMFSCPQSLAPARIVSEIKNGLKKAGVKPSAPPEFTGAAADRALKKIPEKRLIARLGLTKYDRPAPFDTDVDYKPERVKLMLGQHIGAKAVPCVSEGDKVGKADIIALAPEGLGAALHASISGTVEAVTGDYIMIKA